MQDSSADADRLRLVSTLLRVGGIAFVVAASSAILVLFVPLSFVRPIWAVLSLISFALGVGLCALLFIVGGVGPRLAAAFWLLWAAAIVASWMSPYSLAAAVGMGSAGAGPVLLRLGIMASGAVAMFLLIASIGAVYGRTQARLRA